MAMKVFNVGDVLAAADTNEYLVNTKIAVKGADTSRATNTTLTADPDLTLAVDASKSYYVQANIIFTALGGADLKFTWAVPAGTVFTGTLLGLSGGTTVSLGTYQASGSLITATSTFVGIGSPLPMVFSGVLATAGTPGNFTFSWSQSASNATPTVVKQGSSLFLRRVA